MGSHWQLSTATQEQARTVPQQWQWFFETSKRCSASINLGREHWHSNQSCIREEPDRPHLSLIREPGLVVLFYQLLLPYVLAVLRWIPLLEEGGEPHCVITGLDSLHTTIQSPVA